MFDRIERLMLARIEVWLVIILVVSMLMFLGIWAFAIKTWQVFPYQLILEADAFVKGHPADRRSIWTRLKAEFVHNPAEFAVGLGPPLLAEDQLRPVRTVSNPGGTMPDVDAMTFFNREPAKRYFVVFGSFGFRDQDNHFGAVAVDSEGSVYRGWAISPDHWGDPGPGLGMAINDVGQIATNTHGVLTAYDWCGQKLWDAPWNPGSGFPETETYWHHDIVAHGDSFLTFRGQAIMTVDARTGEIKSEIHVVDLVRWAWKSDLSIFDARRNTQFGVEALSPENYTRNQRTLFVHDPFHLNKVDILSSEASNSYPGFEAGDILLSLRELNLIVVVRPSEERIIWWRSGLTSGQHDATFVDGGIEVFDNNISSSPPKPRIARLDLKAQVASTVFNLADWGLVARRGGNFERRGEQLLTVDGSRLVAGKLDGTIEFFLQNGFRTSDGELVNLPITNATELDAERFTRLQAMCETSS